MPRKVKTFKIMTFDGSVKEMDFIWVCDICKTTYAGEKVYIEEDEFFNKSYICGACMAKKRDQCQRYFDETMLKFRKDV